MVAIIIFKVNCSINAKKEKVAIVGNCQELGNWNPHQGLDLKQSPSNNQCWISNPIPLGFNVSLEFKFVVVDLCDHCVIWEKFGSNRKYLPRFYKVTLECTLHDPLLSELIIHRSLCSEDDFEKVVADEIHSLVSFESGFYNEDIMHSIINLNDEKNTNTFETLYSVLVSQGALKSARILSSNSLINQHAITYIKEMGIAVVTKNEFLIFATHFLPVTIHSLDENDVLIGINTKETEYFYFYLADYFKKKYNKLNWIGFLSLEPKFEQFKHKITQILWDRYQMIPIFIEPQKFMEYKKNYCDKLYEKFLEHITPFNKKNYGKSVNSYSLHLELNRLIAEEILLCLNKNNIKNFEKNTLILLNDYQLSLVPYYLYKKRAYNKMNISINLVTPFPAFEQFMHIPHSMKMLDSILLCDLISFNCYDNAKDFINCAKKIYDIDYICEKQGHQMITYLGRHIFIRVVKNSIDQQTINNYLNTQKYENTKKKLQAQVSNKILIYIVEEFKESSLLLIFINILHNILQNNKEFVDIVEVIISIKNVKSYSELKFDLIIKFIEKLNSYYDKPPFKIFEGKNFETRMFYLKNTDLLIDFQLFGKANLEVYEFCLINEKQGQIIVNHSSQYHTAINFFDEIHSIMSRDLYDKLFEIIRKKRSMKTNPTDFALIKKSKDHDLNCTKNALMNNDIWYWLESILIDFKRSVIDQTDATFNRSDCEMTIKCIASHKVYHLKANELRSAIKKSNRRLFIFFYEDVLENINISRIYQGFNCGRLDENNNKSNKLRKIFKTLKESSIIKKIEGLSLDQKNSVYIITSLSCEVADSILGEIKNIGIFAEDGYLYKNSGDADLWQQTCHNNLSWKEIIEKIMSDYSFKTGYSTIINTPNSLTFKANPIIGEFSEMQAKDLYQNVKGVLEQYSNLEVILEDKEVIVKSNNLPKVNIHCQTQSQQKNIFFCCSSTQSLLVEMIFTYEYLKRGKIDFVLGFFGLHNEDIFLALRRYINKHPEHFHLESFSFYPTKIGSSISHAKYYAGIEEVESLIESAQPSYNLASPTLNNMINTR